MALDAVDFLYPTGEITSQMFPDVMAGPAEDPGDEPGDPDDLLMDALEDLVQVWVDEATAKSVSDQAGTHWVYYRAYGAAATRIAATPSRESFHNGEVVRDWGKDRIEYFQNLSNWHRDAYDRLVGDESYLDVKPAMFRVY